MLLRLVLDQLLYIRQIRRHIPKGNKPLRCVYNRFRDLIPHVQGHLSKFVHVGNADASTAVAKA
jgi:hypothetical protein